MWKLYAKSNEAIAIQTTYNKLRNDLPGSCYIGEVKYIDYQTYIKNENEKTYNVMYKRKSFEHEKELRVCYVDNLTFIKNITTETGKFFNADNTKYFEQIPINIETLIEAVYVSPDAPNWFSSLVKDTCEKFGFKFAINQSNLKDQPVY